MINLLAKPSSFDYPCFIWEWLGPGGLPGLQNLWRVALRAAVGSTPIHSRLLLEILKFFRYVGNHSCRVVFLVQILFHNENP